MKRALLPCILLATLLPLAAQTPAKPEGKPAAGETAANMRLSEEQEVFAASAALISASVNLHEDGTAICVHQIGTFSTRIEFKGLDIQEIVKAPITSADKEKGITRRYIAKLVCKAHRIWDGPLVTWSEWRENGYGFFPSTIVVEEIKGSLQARANRIKDFSPGTDSTMSLNR